MEENILIFALIGFVAQIIDGALGMAYGVSANAVLLSLGVAPAAASASVHAAEVFTTGASGLSHLRLGNVDQAAFRRLVIPGIVGGVIGAYLLTALPGEVLKPYIAVYLLLMGIYILFKAWRSTRAQTMIGSGSLVPLGLAGGFFDAIGGGGWGPLVTSTLVARGNNPRLTVGSVNTAEFFVTVSQSIVFIATIGLTHWQVIVGLLLGGVIAAPLAAYICKLLPARALMVLVGVLICLLSVRTLVLAFQ